MRKLTGPAKWTLLGVSVVIGLFLDIGTKTLVKNSLDVGESVSVLGKTLEFYFVYNTGALFGINPRDLVSWFPVNGFFYVFTTIAIVLLILYYRKSPSGTRLQQIGIACILPGALGNLYDRVAYGHLGVVDFIKVDLGFPPFNPWPIFNLADVYITVGVAIIFIELILDERQRITGSSKENQPEIGTHDRP